MCRTPHLCIRWCLWREQNGRNLKGEKVSELRLKNFVLRSLFFFRWGSPWEKGGEGVDLLYLLLPFFWFFLLLCICFVHSVHPFGISWCISFAYKKDLEIFNENLCM